MKNKWGKSLKISAVQSAYHVGTASGWIWYVLKVYGDPHKPYARAFCKVVTPMTGSNGDLGDVYCIDVPGLIDAWVKAHTEPEVVG